MRGMTKTDATHIIFMDDGLMAEGYRIPSAGQNPRTNPLPIFCWIKLRTKSPRNKSLWLLSINQSNLFNEFNKCNYIITLWLFSSIQLPLTLWYFHQSAYTIIFSSIQHPHTLLFFHQSSFHLHYYFFNQSSFHLHYNFFTNPASNEAMTFHQSSFHLRYDFSSIQLPLTLNPTAYTLNQSKF